MTRPQRQPAAVPQIGKAPSSGHPARTPETPPPPPPQREIGSVSADDLLVSFGGRIRPSTRRRMRMYAAGNDREIQEMLEEALVEWLDKRGG